MWTVLRVHNSLVYAGASSEKSDLTTRMPEDDCVFGAEPARTHIGDQSRQGLGRICVVDEQRLGSRGDGLRFTRRRGSDAVPVADESVVDGHVHAARQPFA